MSVMEQGLPTVLSGRGSNAVGTKATRSISKLNELPVGARAVVGSPTSFDGTIVRLLEMGLTAGAEVELTRRGLGAGPIEIRIRGTRVCLRQSDAERFPVTVLGALG